MKVWTYIERGDDGYYASVHLTEKGCLVQTLDNILEVLNIHDQESYEEYVKENEPWHNHGGTPRKDIFPIDQTRTAKELWSIYDYLSEYTWHVDSFDCEIHSSNVKA